MIYTENQNDIINKAVNWFINSSEQIFQISGRAGTGKTTVLFEILKRINLSIDEVAPMAYVGAAAIIMRYKNLINAKTIHSWLYTTVEDYLLDKNGNIIYDTYLNRPKTVLKFIPKDLKGVRLMIIDEASMVPMYMKKDILDRGIKVLAIGDLCQLPPVGDTPAFLYDGKVHYLTDIMRQNKDSGILYLADRILNGLPIHEGFYNDAYVISRNELTDLMIYNSNIVICGKNETRDNINYKVRHDILGINTDMPVYLDKIMCRKNNWEIEIDNINLVNGLNGQVVNTPSVYGYDGKTIKIDFKPNMLNSAFYNLDIDYDYLTSDYKRRQLIKNDKFSIGEKFEYSYACTTHSQQGSQYPYGIYMQEFLNKDIQPNLDYTGITRFSNGVIFVKQNKRFF